MAVHILAGGLAMVFGVVALSAAKGGRLHRRSGMLFVYAMLVMALLGASIAALRGKAPEMNVPAGLLTAYLVVTALTTVRPSTAATRRVDLGAMLAAFAVGLTALVFAGQAMAAGGKRSGFAFPLLMFGVLGVLGGVGDLKVMRAGGLTGAPRLSRHLWRMCLALWIATSSFFLGQAQVFPTAVRRSGVLSLPVLAVLAVLFYWLWRVRRRSYRGISGQAPRKPGTLERLAHSGW